MSNTNLQRELKLLELSRLKAWKARLACLADDMEGHGEECLAEHIDSITAELQFQIERIDGMISEAIWRE